MMRGESSLTMREFLTRERVPFASVHDAVFDFLERRDDVAVQGGHAVNAYVDCVRMTPEVNLVSPRAAALAAALGSVLADRFGIAVHARELAAGTAYRVEHVRKPENRRLVLVRHVESLPPTEQREGILVVAPEELVAGKVIAFHRRRATPKAGTDWRDLAELLLAFPELKANDGPVRVRLDAAGADDAVLATWEELVAQPISPPADDGY